MGSTYAFGKLPLMFLGKLYGITLFAAVMQKIIQVFASTPCQEFCNCHATRAAAERARNRV